MKSLIERIFKKNDEAVEDKPEKVKRTRQQIKESKNTIQELLKFDCITNDGIVIAGNQYSKMYKLIDSNFVTEPEDVQIEILKRYQKLINTFPDNINLSIVIVNRKVDEATLNEAFHVREQGDSEQYDELRQDYNEIIDEKIKEGHNDIVKEKFIMLTVTSTSLADAHNDFLSADISLQDCVSKINRVGVTQLNAMERLELISSILRGSNGVKFADEYGKYFIKTQNDEGVTSVEFDTKAARNRVTSKDMVAPQIVDKSFKTHIMLAEDRYCKSFLLNNLPTSLDTIFLTDSTNIPYEMVTVIQFRNVPRNRALNMVKNRTVGVKADVSKQQKQAYRGNYSPDLIDEDLVADLEEVQALREGIVREGKKLFFTTLVVTMFGENVQELKNCENLYRQKCSANTITPNYLIAQQVEGLNTAICIGNSKVVGDRLLTSDDIRALFPFNVQDLQDKQGYFYGTNTNSQNMIVCNRKHLKLANGIVIGQAGSGKSFITKGEIILTLLNTPDDVIILDPENEYKIVADLMNGTVIDLEVVSDYHINPCDMSMEWDEKKASPLTEKCDYMVGLVESILGKGREVTAYDTNAIHRATRRMYEDYINEMKRRHANGDNRNIDTTICPTLKDFYKELIADNTAEGNKIAMAVEPYCIGSFNIFAHHTNVDLTSRLIVFNTSSLPEKMKEMAMQVCLSYIWTKIVKNREQNKLNHTNKFIWNYLDEFHLFMRTESSANTIETYYRRVRKYGACITGLTQNVEDLLNTTQGGAIFQNTGFFLFFNQQPIGRNLLQRLYGISDSLIEKIKDAPRGTGLLYNGTVLIPFNYQLPRKSKLYKIMTTDPNDIVDTEKVKAKNEEHDRTVLNEAKDSITESNENDDFDSDDFDDNFVNMTGRGMFGGI